MNTTTIKEVIRHLHQATTTHHLTLENLAEVAVNLDDMTAILLTEEDKFKWL